MVVRSLLDRIRSPFRRKSHRKHSVEARPSACAVEQLETRQLLTINFNFQYPGPISANGIGFEDPIMGAARRTALTNAGQQLGALFENDATVVIDVTSVIDPNGGLAQAGSQLVLNANTPIFGGDEVVRNKILTGVDLNGSEVDGTLEVNWFNNFEISANPADVDATEFDFYSLIAHELTHALGFSSQITQAGNDLFGRAPGQIGTWSRYDGFLQDAVGNSVLDGNGVLNITTWNNTSTGGSSVVGAGLFFGGPTAVGLNGGSRVGLFTPSPWQDGSSVSHLDDSNAAYAGMLMLSATTAGPGPRNYSIIEEGIMIDLGYTFANNLLVTPTDNHVVTDLGGSSTFDVTLGRQPLNDVVVTITTNDPGEVTLSTSGLLFTPADWNVAQTVTMTGVSDMQADGTQLVNVKAEIDALNSSPEFAGVQPINLTVRALDNDGSLPGKPVFNAPGQLPATSSPEFDWTPVVNGRTYSLTISEFFTGTVVQQITGLTVPRHTFATPFINGIYQAVVVATNAGGTAGEPSDPLIFSIGDPVIPGRPLIVSPIQSSIVTSNQTAIEWTPVVGGSQYEIYILASGTVFRETVAGIDTGNGTLSYIPTTPLKEGPNAVWIRALNPFDTPGKWSSPVGFTVDAFEAPDVPVITAPSGTTITDATPTFGWTQAANAASFDIWVNELPGGKSSVVKPTRRIYVTEIFDTAYTHFNALNDATHRVWVRSRNAAGELSAWSAFKQFTVNVPAPHTPEIDPLGTIEDQSPLFTWHSANGEAFGADTTFYLWVNNLTTGETRVILQEDITQTSYQTPFDLPQGRFRAWVQAVGAVGIRSAWSAPMTFIIDQLAPGNTTVTGPVPDTGKTVVESDTPEIAWSVAAGAATYELWINHRESATVRIIHETGLTGSTFIPATALPEGSFTAWVRGFNAAGEVGEWSSAFHFVVDVPHPQTPFITGPATNAVNTVSTSMPTITWDSPTPDSAETFHLQVEHLQTGELVVNEVGLTERSYKVPFQLQETSYRTRVRSTNSAGEQSAWSDWSTFRIDIANATTPVVFGPTGTVTSAPVTFEWQHSPDNVSYQILVRDQLTREQIRINVTINKLEFRDGRAVYTDNAGDLTDGTYRFWVRSFNAQGTASGWSNALTFTLDTAWLEDDADDSEIEILLTSLSRPAVYEQEHRTNPPVPADLPAPAESVMRASVRSSESNTERSVIDEPNDAVELLEAVMEELADPSHDLELTAE